MVRQYVNVQFQVKPLSTGTSSSQTKKKNFKKAEKIRRKELKQHKKRKEKVWKLVREKKWKQDEKLIKDAENERIKQEKDRQRAEKKIMEQIRKEKERKEKEDKKLEKIKNRVKNRKSAKLNKKYRINDFYCMKPSEVFKNKRIKFSFVWYHSWFYSLWTYFVKTS